MSGREASQLWWDVTLGARCARVGTSDYVLYADSWAAPHTVDITERTSPILLRRFHATMRLLCAPISALYRAPQLSVPRINEEELMQAQLVLALSAEQRCRGILLMHELGLR